MPETLHISALASAEAASRALTDRNILARLKEIEHEHHLIDLAWEGFKKERAKSRARIYAIEKKIRQRQREIADDYSKELRKLFHIEPITAGFTPAPREPKQISVTTQPEAIQANENPAQ